MGEARVHLQRAEHQLRHLLARARREGGRVPGRDLHRQGLRLHRWRARHHARRGVHRRRPQLAPRQARAAVRPDYVRQELVLGALVVRAALRGARELRGADVPRLGRGQQHAAPRPDLEPHGHGEQPLVPHQDARLLGGPRRRALGQVRAPHRARVQARRLDGLHRGRLEPARGLHDHAPRRRGDAHPREPGGADRREARRRRPGGGGAGGCAGGWVRSSPPGRDAHLHGGGGEARHRGRLLDCR